MVEPITVMPAGRALHSPEPLITPRPMSRPAWLEERAE